MAYMSQEKKKAIEPKVKAILAKYKLKGSLSVRNHSTLVLTVTQGAIDFASLWINKGHKFDGSVNVYHFKDQYEGVARDFLTEVYAAMMEGNHDNSDSMTDYFDVGWYTDIDIGKWDKPYVYTGEKAVAKPAAPKINAPVPKPTPAVSPSGKPYSDRQVKLDFVRAKLDSISDHDLTAIAVKLGYKTAHEQREMIEEFFWLSGLTK